MARRNAALATALFFAVFAAPNGAAERQVETLYKKARDMYGCSERWSSANVVSECRQVIAAFRAAEAASDATPDDQDFLVAERLLRQATLVAVLRKQRDRTTARKELDTAFQELDALAPGTTNLFARVKTLDLQRQAALLALDDGNQPGADAAIQVYRDHAKGYLGALEQLRGNTKAMGQQRVGAIDAGNFEMELGDRYAKMLEDNEAADKNATRGKALEAYESAREWAVVRADNDWNGFAEKTPQALYADASLELARLAHEADDMNALATYVGQAKAVTCGSADADADPQLGERCLRSMLMERWVTGENQALLRKIAEQQDAQTRAIMDTLRKKD